MGLMLDSDHCVSILRQKLVASDFVGPTESLHVSAVTVMELVAGALRSAHVNRNLRGIDEILSSVSILPFDESCARQTAHIKASLAKTGAILSDLDMQIAGTALAHGLPLVTHNTRHFGRIAGLALLDWLS